MNHRTGLSAAFLAVALGGAVLSQARTAPPEWAQAVRLSQIDIRQIKPPRHAGESLAKPPASVAAPAVLLAIAELRRQLVGPHAIDLTAELRRFEIDDGTAWDNYVLELRYALHDQAERLLAKSGWRRVEARVSLFGSAEAALAEAVARDLTHFIAGADCPLQDCWRQPVAVETLPAMETDGTAPEAAAIPVSATRPRAEPETASYIAEHAGPGVTIRPRPRPDRTIAAERPARDPAAPRTRPRNQAHPAPTIVLATIESVLRQERTATARYRHGSDDAERAVAEAVPVAARPEEPAPSFFSVVTATLEREILGREPDPVRAAKRDENRRPSGPANPAAVVEAPASPPAPARAEPKPISVVVERRVEPQPRMSAAMWIGSTPAAPAREGTGMWLASDMVEAPTRGWISDEGSGRTLEVRLIPSRSGQIQRAVMSPAAAQALDLIPGQHTNLSIYLERKAAVQG